MIKKTLVINGVTRNLAMPVWNWGRLYEDLLRRSFSLIVGTWSN